MKLAIIAADGRSGRALVEAAIESGHTVRAGIRGDNPFSEHKNLEVMQCDARKPAQVGSLIKGCNVVVSLIGHVKGSPDNVQTAATKVIVAEMKKVKTNRIISLTGTGVRFPGDKITLADRVLNLAISVVDPARVKDGKDHAEVLKKSGLDWTLIRVLKLQNTDMQPFVLREKGPTKLYVSRKDVARAILQVLSTDRFHKSAPIIGKVD